MAGLKGCLLIVGFCCDVWWGNWGPPKFPYFCLWIMPVYTHSASTWRVWCRPMTAQNVSFCVRITTTLLLQSWQIFTGESHQEWAIVGVPTSSPSKSKTADSGYIEFHKMRIYSLLDEITTQRCPWPDVTMHDVISWTSATNVGRSQWLYEMFEPQLKKD